jgi:hypothetical protein
MPDVRAAEARQRLVTRSRRSSARLQSYDASGRRASRTRAPACCNTRHAKRWVEPSLALRATRVGRPRGRGRPSGNQASARRSAWTNGWQTPGLKRPGDDPNARALTRPGPSSTRERDERRDKMAERDTFGQADATGWRDKIECVDIEETLLRAFIVPAVRIHVTVGCAASTSPRPPRGLRSFR